MKDWKFHCAVLRVAEDADLKEVRKAYRKLALQLHPDKHDNSRKSKEEFQQLNESYQHVAAALISGHRPADPAPPPQPRAWEPKAESTPPPLARAKFELRENVPPRRKGLPRVWIHAAIACLGLLVFSFFVERPVQSLPDYKPEAKELFLKNWCFISRLENGTPVKEVSELWSQPVCEEQCSSLAASHDISCVWNGQEFRAYRAPIKAHSSTLAAVEDAATPCEIAVDRGSSRSSTPYRGLSEDTCRTICDRMLQDLTREGVQCSWKGAVFKAQEIRKANNSPTMVEASVSIPRRGTPASGAAAKIALPGQKDETPAFPTIEDSMPEPLNGFRSTCYMSVVSEEGVDAQSFPNDTSRACEGRCMAEISASPTGKEIKCAFAGRALITYVPDPMMSYLARDPSSSGLIGHQKAEACNVRIESAGSPVDSKTTVTTKQLCAVRCQAEFVRRNIASQVTCTFKGELFFLDTIRK